MPQITTVVLAPALAHPGLTGVSSDYQGQAQLAAGYYKSNKSFQTITWNLGTDFSGSIIIEASLKTSPIDSDWFPAYYINTETEKSGYHELPGSFVWIRVHVTDWPTGAIQLITASY